MIKKEFKEIFDPNGNTRYYVQHNKYKNLTIPLDVFNDMSDEEVERYINEHLKDINKEISSIPKPQNPVRVLSPEEVASAFSELRRSLRQNESFKEFFERTSA
jgi:hypothetical protein